MFTKASRHIAILYGVIFCIASGAAKATDKDADRQKRENGNEQTLVLTQKCKALYGDYMVYIDGHNVCIKSHNMLVFASAPKWNMTIVNLTKKVYYQSDYRQCLRLIITARAPFNPFADASTFKPNVKSDTIDGLPTEQWVSNFTKNGKHSSAKCWTLKSKYVEPHCAELISTYCGVPYIGLPLQCAYTGSGNDLMPMNSRQFDVEGSRQQEYRWLETKAVEHSLKPVKPYTIPKEFKPTKNYSEITAVTTNSHSAVDAKFILEDISKHPDSLFNSR